MSGADRVYGGLCEFCSYEGPFEWSEEVEQFLCPQCRQAPRSAPEDEWLG